MNINHIYSENFYIIINKKTGDSLFGTRLFEKPSHAKLAWGNAVRFNNCWLTNLEQYRNQGFDKQDEYEIVEVTNTIHKKIEI